MLDDASLHERVRDYVGARAQQVDGSEVALRDGIAHLATLGALERGVYGAQAPEDLTRMCEITGTVALDCMSQAFSLWCHRMAIEYFHQADEDSPARARFLPQLRTGETLGSTSFAAATAAFTSALSITSVGQRLGAKSARSRSACA